MSEEEDLFGLAPLVRHIASHAGNGADSASLVIGLYGEWGAGKTTILNLVEKELKTARGQNTKAVVVKFDPWHFSGTESLLATFFRTIASAARELKREGLAAEKGVSDALDKMGALVSAGALVAGVGWAAPILDALRRIRGLERTQQSLDAQRELVVTGLRAFHDRTQGGRIVVMIDDVDRLEDADVRLVLKAVRMLADLPAVTIIVALDHRRTVAALGSSVGGSTADAAAYLEKIIELPITVPALAPERLASLASREARKLFLRERHESDEELPESYAWMTGAGIEKMFVDVLRTPRDLIRVRGALRFVAQGASSVALDARDATCLAVLQALFPSVVLRVRKELAFLTGRRTLEESIIASVRPSDQRRAEAQRRLERIAGLEEHGEDQAPLSDRDSRSALRILEGMFPQATALTGPSPAEERAARRANRIGSPHRCRRYFRFHGESGEVPEAVVRQLISEVINGTLEARTLREVAEMGDDSVEYLFERLVDEADGWALPLLRGRAESIVRAGRGVVQFGVLRSYAEVVAQLIVLQSAGVQDGQRAMYAESAVDLILTTGASIEALEAIVRCMQIALRIDPQAGVNRVIATRAMAAVYETLRDLLWQMRDLDAERFVKGVWSARSIILAGNGDTRVLGQAIEDVLNRDDVGQLQVLATLADFSSGTPVIDAVSLEAWRQAFAGIFSEHLLQNAVPAMEGLAKPPVLRRLASEYRAAVKSMREGG